MFLRQGSHGNVHARCQYGMRLPRGSRTSSRRSPAQYEAIAPSDNAIGVMHGGNVSATGIWPAAGQINTSIGAEKNTGGRASLQ